MYKSWFLLTVLVLLKEKFFAVVRFGHPSAKKLGLPVEIEDWDANTDGPLSMLLDAKTKSQKEACPLFFFSSGVTTP